MPVLRTVSSSLFVKLTYQLDTVSPTRQSHVYIDCCLHQRIPLNSGQSLKLQWCRYVLVGFNRTHLIVSTGSVITAGQLNLNS